MTGMQWPDKFNAFKDIADKHYSDADESVLDSSAKGHRAGLRDLQSALEDADRAYTELLGAFEADGKRSDAYSAVEARQLEFRRKGGALAAKALAGQQFMEAAVGPVKDSKSKDQDAGNKALETIRQTQFWPDWMLHRAGKETHMEQARRQLEDDMSAHEAARVNALNGTYRPPEDGDYGFDGQPTSWGSRPATTSSDYGRTGARGEAASSASTYQQVGERSQPAASQTGYQHIGARDQSVGSTESYGQIGDRSGTSASGPPDPRSAASSTGGAQSAGGVSAPQSGAGSPPGGGSAATGLQSGAAVADTAPASAPPSPSVSGSGTSGGVGAPPSIGGFGGGAGAVPSPAPRIGNVGGGPEATRTGVQGSVAAEKPVAQSSPAGSGSQQGSGLSRGGSGAGSAAAGAATQAQSAQQAALRGAMRGDTAGGASGAGKHLDHQNQALGTERVTRLSPTALQSAHAQSAQLLSSFGGLTGSLASAHPASGAGELAQWIVGGGTVVGAGRAGFLADGFTWGRIEQPPFDHAGLTGLVFLFEDFRVEPNTDAGVFRPVEARATTTGWMGEVDPAMRLPEGTRILDRAAAPAATDHLAEAGVLARALGRWLLESGLDGDTSWRLVAVCFLAEPDAETVDGLLRLPHQVEAYWPGRLGYEAAAPHEAVADARALGGEELRVKRRDPLRHAEDMARLDPDGLYDPAGLPAKEASWYREAVERAQKRRLTNARWKQELDQCRREERGGGPNW